MSEADVLHVERSTTAPHAVSQSRCTNLSHTVLSSAASQISSARAVAQCPFFCVGMVRAMLVSRTQQRVIEITRLEENGHEYAVYK